MQIEITFDNTPIIYEEDTIKYINPTKYDPTTSNTKSTEYTTKNNPTILYTTKYNPATKYAPTTKFTATTKYGSKNTMNTTKYNPTTKYTPTTKYSTKNTEYTVKYCPTPKYTPTMTRRACARMDARPAPPSCDLCPLCAQPMKGTPRWGVCNQTSLARGKSDEKDVMSLYY